MKNKIPIFISAFLTFGFGVGVVYLWYFKFPANREQVTAAIVVSIEAEKLSSFEKPDFWRLPENFSPLKKGEFFAVVHACGNGYADGWLAYDGSHLSEGFDSLTRKDFDEEVTKSGTVLEKIENYPNKDGEKGLRVVLYGTNKDSGKNYYSILWFGKWYKKETGRYYINAPNLEIALELEKYLIKESQKVTARK